MLPIIKANTQSADANRELILNMIEMQLSQNKNAAVLMRGIADSVSALAAELEEQQQAAEQRLTDLAASLNTEADGALRQRAGNALRAAALRLTNMKKKLRGEL